MSARVAMASNSSTATGLAILWHSAPRIDLTFSSTNSTFQPEQLSYQQSLLIWAAVPVVALMVNLFILLIFFCLQCCRRTDKTKTKNHIPCLRWSAAVLAVISICVVAVGYYGNRESEKGLESVTDAFDGTIDVLKNAELEIRALNSSAETLRQQGDGRLREPMTSLQRTLDVMTLQIVASDVDTMSQRLLNAVNLTDYRWLMMAVLLTTLLVIFLLLLFGIVQTSKPVIVLFIIGATIVLVFCWISAGVHMAFSMMVGDFCVDLENTFIGDWSSQMNNDVLVYYVTCDTNLVSSSFNQSLYRAESSLKDAQDSMMQTDSQAFADISDEIVTMKKSLTKLSGISLCSTLRRQYVSGVVSLCHRALPGLSLVFLCTAVVAVIMSVLVVLSSLLWKHSAEQNIHWHRATLTSDSPTAAVPDDSVFTPSVDIDEPSVEYSSIISRSNRGRRHQEMPLIPSRHLTPPPEYSTDEFYRQYSDVSPSIYGIGSVSRSHHWVGTPD